MRITTIHSVKHAFDTASDETVMMSIRDIHVHGLDSYVLENKDGTLFRVYHARQNLMALNYPYSPGLILGIHNHRYDLALIGLQGKSISYQWHRDARSSYKLWHYRWQSYVGQSGQYTKMGVQGLSLHSSQELFHAQPFYLSYNRLHTVWAEAGAMWAVQEYMVKTEVTDLYTDSSTLDMRGVYHKFESVDDVRASFARAIDA
jgi:hypothetical protein